MKFAIAIVLCFAVNAFAATTRDLRIVGGKQAAEGQFPYQISLRSFGFHSCGGSILDENTILCAAHCVQQIFLVNDTGSFTIVTGTNKLNSGGDSYKVKSIIYHQDYEWLSLHNDISIIKVEGPIVFNDKVQPIKLREAEMPGDADAVLSGWGLTSYPGSIPNDLQFINLRTLSVKECQEKQNSAPVIASQICTLTQRGEGACHADDGGPLVDSNREQIGIMSWVNPCATGRPDVFTRVGSYIDWINTNK